VCTKRSFELKPAGTRRRRGRRKRCCRRAIEEEAEIVGKAWREVKATTANCALALLCGGTVLRNGATRNWLGLTQFVMKIFVMHFIERK
jgi:hypothetical protein